MTNDESNPKSECRMTKEIRNPNVEGNGMKTPKTKLQTPKKLQISSSNSAVSLRHLGFGAWDFSGAWCLGFGVWSIVILQPQLK